MSRQAIKPTSRSAGWIEILSGVENMIERTLAEASRREEMFASRLEPGESTCFSRLAKSSERWSGLWLRSANGEEVLSTAEKALAAVENDLRKHLDGLVTCRQNLAQWLDRAVG